MIYEIFLWNGVVELRKTIIEKESFPYLSWHKDINKKYTYGASVSQLSKDMFPLS